MKEQDLIKGRPLVLVQFGLASCLPCHNIRQKIKSWILGHPKVAYEYVDMAQNSAFCGQMEIFSAPTLILYTEGQKSLQVSRSFSLLEVFEQIQKYEKLMEL